MAILEATLLDTVRWHINGGNLIYADMQSATSALYQRHNIDPIFIGQRHEELSPTYFADTLYRVGLRFDLADFPEGATLTAAIVKLYGHSDDSTDDFDITVVGGDFSSPPIFSDYSKGGVTSYGSLNSGACAVGSYNSITINSVGLSALNAAMLIGEVELYLRSAEDIAASAPTTKEFYGFKGHDDNNPPVLELTYFIFGGDEYPDAVSFPTQGRIDLATYSAIASYLMALDDDISITTDGDGNVDLGVANWITWAGTSEKIAYDDGNSRVTVTTLESSSIITVAADLVTANLTVTTTGSAVDSTVAADALLSDMAYASLKSKITDDELVFSGISAPTPADDEGDIYMDSTSGDLVLKTRDDGQAGTKTDILADFSAM